MNPSFIAADIRSKELCYAMQCALLLLFLKCGLYLLLEVIFIVRLRVLYPAPAYMYITALCCCIFISVFIFRCYLYLLQIAVPGAVTSKERCLRYKKEAKEET